MDPIMRITHQASFPNQIRYLLVLNYITQNANVFKTNHNNPDFYLEAISKIRYWLEMSDEDLTKEFNKIPYRV